MLQQLAEGLRLGLEFNPITSLVGAIGAAMLLSPNPGRVRQTVAIVWVTAAWLIGDVSAALPGSGLSSLAENADTAMWALLAVRLLVSAGVGYALPTWAGTFVGRRVTFGTGWLSAGVVAGTVALAVGQIVSGAL